jgi:hypothetical protein
MPNIPRRYSHFVFSVLQSGLTCSIAAAIASVPYLSAGTFAVHWLRSLFLSWAVMLPVVVIAAPVIRGIVDRVTRQEQ